MNLISSFNPSFLLPFAHSVIFRVALRRVPPAPRLDANCAGQGRLLEDEDYGR
jgi:hypothetical protein